MLSNLGIGRYQSNKMTEGHGAFRTSGGGAADNPTSKARDNYRPSLSRVHLASCIGRSSIIKARKDDQENSQESARADAYTQTQIPGF